MQDETFVQHLPLVELPPGNTPLVQPIYQSVKFDIDDINKLRDPSGTEYFFYSRDANPTVRQLELVLAKLQGQEDGIAVASGVAALSVPLISLLRTGDHVIVFLESYKPTRYLVGNLLARFGVEHTFLSVNDLDRLGDAVKPGKTKLLMVESPTNPMARVPDFDKIFAVAKRHQITTLLDNTFAGVHQHGQYPFDIFVHSLTKFVSGHGDVMGGVILSSRETIKKLKEDSVQIGATLDPHTAYLILRGLKTYFPRYRQQSDTALTVAKWLEGRSEVKKVYYPGLESHPDHAVAVKQMKDFGAIVPFILNIAPERMAAFFKALQLFRFAGSVGSTESLVISATFYGKDLPDADRARALIVSTSVRLSVGLESSADLIADLAHALQAATTAA
jgi:cystathionine beta-lyase/cystathionine gamma-synthase